MQIAQSTTQQKGRNVNNWSARIQIRRRPICQAEGQLNLFEYQPVNPRKSTRRQPNHILIIKKRKSINIEYCNGCGDEVALLQRKDVKLAWTEATLKIGGNKRVVYWCQPCTETKEIHCDEITTGQKTRKIF